ncbi:MAG: hemerythrin domain-containing protein [Candidatus Thiodiazotropha sp.]|jgi:hemerythrin
MTKLINPIDEKYLLGVSQIDQTHQEFIELVNRMNSADKPSFIILFQNLIEHTESHFSKELDLMKASAFSAIREHTDEHQRVLGDLRRFGSRVAKGSLQLGRAYITQQLPNWFELHTCTMDSALAAHLKKCEAPKQCKPV